MTYNSQSNSLIAKEGHYITQANDVHIKNRIFLSKLVLSKNDSPKNYKAITDNEAKTLYR